MRMCLRFVMFITLATILLDSNHLILAKKAKKKKPIEYPDISSHKRPSDITPSLYCEACNAILD